MRVARREPRPTDKQWLCKFVVGRGSSRAIGLPSHKNRDAPFILESLNFRLHPAGGGVWLGRLNAVCAAVR
jgi:hypothetical protein